MYDYNAFHRFVSKKHADQVDKDGSPYIQHLERVAAYTRAFAENLPSGMMTEEEIGYAAILGLLHDTLEDKKATEEDILAVGGTEDMIADLRMLARPEGPDRPEYQAWILDICEKAPLAVLLTKLGDNRDNGDPDRLEKLPDDLRKRFEKKYSVARANMTRELSARVENFLKAKATLGPAI